MNKNTEIELQVLDSVHANHSVTQRDLARDAGVALGLVNAYLKRCIKKGFIKVKQVSLSSFFKKNE